MTSGWYHDLRASVLHTLDRRHASSATRRGKAGQEGRREQEGRGSGHRNEIGRSCLEQHVLQHAAGQLRTREPEHDPAGGQSQPLCGHETRKRRGPGAKRQPDRQLAPPLVDRPRQQPVDTNRGKHTREDRERREHGREKAGAGGGGDQSFVHGPDIVQGHRAVNAAQRLPDPCDNSGRVGSAGDDRHRPKRKLSLRVIDHRFGGLPDRRLVHVADNADNAERHAVHLA
jgi:hypothetical protein